MKKTCAVLIFVVLLFTYSQALSATFCVGNSSELQSALNTAAANGEDDTVLIIQGTYVGNFSYASAETNSLDIEGGFEDNCLDRNIDPINTALYGNNTGRVLDLPAPQSTQLIVNGLALQRGAGGLYTWTKNGKVVLLNNLVTNNSTKFNGGGIYISAATAVLINNRIEENSAQQCGGGLQIDVENLTLNNNTIAENSANIGGGLYSWGDGGTHNVSIFNNIFAGNSADMAGGMTIGRATGYLANNIIVENSTDIDGGGLNIQEPYGLTLTNNTIAMNSAHHGGGVAVDLYNNSDIVNIYNNIFWNNSVAGPVPMGADLCIDNDDNRDSISSIVHLYNNNFDQSSRGTYMQRPFVINSSNLNRANPLFVNPGNSDLHLAGNSPCINTGSNNAPDLPKTDKDGNPRVSGGIIDMGAYEHSGAPAASLLAPTLTTTTNGTVIICAWAAVENADGYKFSYAPYPYTGPDSIYAIDTGTKRSLSAELWYGATYLVAVRAYNEYGKSDYSNIVLFEIK